MSFESGAEPIKLGVLMDWALPPDHPQERVEDFFFPLELVFRDGLEGKVIDRPVELIVRSTWGLPMGSVKAVIDAFGELVDEGCLAVFGPSISDNCIPMREAIEERFRVPAISVSGSDDWLGEWTFSLPQGSLTDEPIFWADILAREGHTEVGVLIEQSLVGDTYARHFRAACQRLGIRIVAEEQIAQTADNVEPALRSVREAKATAFVHCGFGFGLMMVNSVLGTLDWDPLRLMGTAFQNAWFHQAAWDAMLGWTGVDQYDEANAVGQSFLDRFSDVYGRRPAWVVPLMNRDIATALLHAFADAHPLSPRGVKDALERVKMVPAAAGSPGTRISFGKWTRRGWMGAGYLVARRLDPDGENSHLVARFGDL
ncbi:MAG TPA: ABC transporter substrate-binding protein [Mycobacteriales bacterium]|nr:ABC transporter substrate-binding protein [Mycobacteriales bacterium]